MRNWQKHREATWSREREEAIRQHRLRREAGKRHLDARQSPQIRAWLKN